MVTQGNNSETGKVDKVADEGSAGRFEVTKRPDWVGLGTTVETSPSRSSMASGTALSSASYSPTGRTAEACEAPSYDRQDASQRRGRGRSLNDQTPRYWTIDQLAVRWQVSSRTVRRQILSGELRAVRIGHQLRVADDFLQRFEERHQFRA